MKRMVAKVMNVGAILAVMGLLAAFPASWAGIPCNCFDHFPRAFLLALGVEMVFLGLGALWAWSHGPREDDGGW